MGRDEVLAILRSRQAELKALGVKFLALFGSMARDEAGLGSDIDLLIEFEEGKTPQGLAFLGFEQNLENWLGRGVDLANPHRLHWRIQQRVLAEAIPILPPILPKKNRDKLTIGSTMSDNQPRKDWRVYIDDMLEAAAKLQRFTDGISLDSFLADEMRMSAVRSEIITIGEAVDKLMKIAPEIPQRYPDVSWNQMKGMRNRLVHGYQEIDWTIAWETVRESIPTLIPQLRKLLQAEDETEK